MMSDHVTKDQLFNLRSQSLSSGQVLTVARHLSSCAECARMSAELFTEKAVTAVDEGLRENSGPHLDPNHELFAFVDGDLSGQERARCVMHLAECAQCRQEVDDLSRDRHTRHWLSIAAAAIAAMFLLVVLAVIQQSTRAPVTQPVRDRASVQGQKSVNAMRAAPTQYPVPAWNAAVAAALSTGRAVTPPWLRALQPSADALRGTTDFTPDTLSPVATVVESRQPELEWPAVRDAVSIVTVAQGDEPFVVSNRLHENHWIVNRPLTRGSTYEWAVEIQRDGQTVRILPSPPAPRALFRVADESAVRELADARTRAKGDHLLLGILYARHGMIPEARRELDVYIAQNPSSAAGKRLRESLGK